MDGFDKERAIKLIACIICKNFAWHGNKQEPAKDKQGRWHHPSCNAITKKR